MERNKRRKGGTGQNSKSSSLMQSQVLVVPSTLPSLLAEEACGCSHNVPTFSLAQIFPMPAVLLKVLLLTPIQILSMVSSGEDTPVCPSSQHTANKQRNKKHGCVYLGCSCYGWLTLLSLHLWDSAWLSFPFCKLAGDTVSPQPPFPLPTILCWAMPPV